MTFNVTSPITGASQTGLTSPTYTTIADSSPDSYTRQFAVTGLGGTQAGVIPHSVSSPFVINMSRPQAPKGLQPVNPVTGALGQVPYNTYKVRTTKGVIPLAGQSSRPLKITTIIEVPAGADTADPLSIRAALSAHFGAIAQQSSNIGDTVQSSLL